MLTLGIVLTLICYTLQIEEIWTPRQLATYVEENINVINQKNNFYYVVDPNEYLSEDQEMKMYELMKKIYEKRKVKVIFMVIHKMSEDYTTSISSFVEQYVDEFFNEQNVDDYMFILFSIDDRQNNISTGEKVRKKFQDDVCLYYLEELTNYLQDGKYYEAFMKLLDFIKKRKKTAQEEEESIFVICFCSIVCVVVFGFFVFIIIGSVKLYRVQEFFDKIKDKKISSKIFYENCVICLESLDNGQIEALLEAENKNKEDDVQKTNQKNTSFTNINEEENQNQIISVQNYNKKEEAEIVNNSINNKEKEQDKEQNENDKVVLNIRDNNDKIQNDNIEKIISTSPPPAEEEKKVNEIKEHNNNPIIENNNNIENKKEEETNTNKIISIISKISTNKINILKCGHVFHKKCLEEWMKKSNICPLCREDITKLKEDEASKLGKGVLNIQETISPVFLSNLYFDSVFFRVRMRSRGHHSGGVRGFGGGGRIRFGGASSRW